VTSGSPGLRGDRIGHFGLRATPAAVEQVIGLVEAVAAKHDVPHPFQRTVATSDGESIRAFRYASERQSRTLFYTTGVPTLRRTSPTPRVSARISPFSADDTPTSATVA
jgi:hypothetical protein